MRYWCKNRRTYFIDRYKNNCRLVINLVARMNSICRCMMIELMQIGTSIYDDTMIEKRKRYNLKAYGTTASKYENVFFSSRHSSVIGKTGS